MNLGINTPTNIMPMLMNFSTPEHIQDGIEEPLSYDEVNQINYEMRTVGTRCLRHHGTTRRNGKVSSYSDPKNETDDSKVVR